VELTTVQIVSLMLYVFCLTSIAVLVSLATIAKITRYHKLLEKLAGRKVFLCESLKSWSGHLSLLRTTLDSKDLITHKWVNASVVIMVVDDWNYKLFFPADKSIILARKVMPPEVGVVEIIQRIIDKFDQETVTAQ